MKDSNLFFLRGTLLSNEMDDDDNITGLELVTYRGTRYLLNCGELFSELNDHVYENVTLIVVPLSKAESSVLVVAMPANPCLDMDECSIDDYWGQGYLPTVEDLNSDFGFEGYDSVALHNRDYNPRTA